MIGDPPETTVFDAIKNVEARFLRLLRRAKAEEWKRMAHNP
jgi:hypothetical protein